MSVIYSKVKMSNNIFEACKLVRNFMTIPISEIKNRIQKGEVFTEENLTTKRPGNGISPMKWYEILGKKATRDFLEDELIDI